MAVAAVAALGIAWVDKLIHDVHERERRREIVLEHVLDELRSRVTAVTLAVGMFRRRWAGEPAGATVRAGVAEVVAGAGEGTVAGTKPVVVAVRDESRLREQALATLESEAELLRVDALDLAAWLRFEAGRVSGERERVDLAALAERCSKRLAMAALARQVQLRYRGAAGPATVVLGDRALLELLCLTLIAAAVDRALPGSGVQVEVWSDGGGVRLDVTGEAPGFQRAGGRGVRRPGADPEMRVDLARRITRLHGGEWVANPDHPLHWRVVLPAAHGPFGSLRLLPFRGRGVKPAVSRGSGRRAAAGAAAGAGPRPLHQLARRGAGQPHPGEAGPPTTRD